MSKNITIQEGGVAKQLTVDKLKTNLIGGGTCLWVPEDEVQLTTKSITENGTYNAGDDGYYGYSQVMVNVAGGSGDVPGGPGSSVIGRDEDGDEAIVSVDDDGNIQSEKIPSSIRVITPPTNPYGIYTNGQAITTDGMAVKAYLASGDEYGTVQNDEITLNPTTAVYDASTDTIDDYSSGGVYARKLTEDAYGLELDNDFIVYYSSAITGHYPGGETVHLNGGLTQNNNNEIYYAVYNGGLYCAGLFNEIQVQLRNSAGVSVFSHTSPGPNFSFVRTLNDKASVFDAIQESTVDPTGINPNSLEPVRAGSRQQITVSWPRPGDGKVLETTFEILVAPPIYGDSEN